MSMRDAIRMDDDEVAAFLASGFRAHVSTLNRDGSPHVVPITYVVLDDPATSERVADLFCLKVPEEHRDAARGTLLVLAAERVVVSVQPQRVSSWDHNKMSGVKPQEAGR